VSEFDGGEVLKGDIVPAVTKKLEKTWALFSELPEMETIPDFIKIVNQIINRWRSIFVSQESSVTVISCKLILFSSA
jgi:hypothetical protein